MFSKNNGAPESSQGKTSHPSREIAPDTSFVYRYLIVEPAHIGLLRFLLESYDNIFFLRTLNAREGSMELGCTLSCRRAALDILTALKADVSWVPFSPLPGNIPPL